MTGSAPAVSAGDHGGVVAEALLALCGGPSAPAGTRLPTERELSERLGISRTTVRRGLAALEAQGRISRQVGRGTFLREPTALSAFVVPGPDEADTVGPAGLMAVRRTIEPQVLALVVGAATSRDFEEMERCVRGGDAAGSRDEFEAWDFALHHAIVAASHNPLVVRMYEPVEVARHGQVWGNLKRRNDSAEGRRAYQEDHRAIVDALKAREVDLAVKAMHAHLERVSTVLFGPGSEGLAVGVEP